MPGVPSSRGCDACRRQKKRCDLSVPSCSRCTRLRIDCIGVGQKFKFQEPVINLDFKAAPAPRRQSPNGLPLSRTPSNDLTHLTGKLISQLEVTDLRYDLAPYGRFLKDIPSRLGEHEALDASSLAFTKLWSCLHQPNHSPAALKSFGDSMKILRSSLSDPVKARTPNTLCAIWLTWMCEGWMTSQDDWSVGHGEGAEYILSGLNFEESKSSFEVELLLCMTGPVLLEAIFNPRVKLDTWLWRLLDTYYPQTPEGPQIKPEFQKHESMQRMMSESLSLRNIAKVTLFMRSPETRVVEMRSLYTLMRTETRMLNQYMASAAQTSVPSTMTDITSPTQERRVFARCQATTGILLMLTIVANNVLQAFYPSDESLTEDATAFFNYAVKLAEATRPLRPLGARYVHAMFMPAWVATDSLGRARIEGLLAEYFTSEALGKWITGSRWLEREVHKARLKAGSGNSLGQTSEYIVLC